MVTRTNPRQLSFSSVEIDPLLHRRVDYQRFQSGLAACQGFLPLPQGGVTRAPGTYYRGRTKGDSRSVLVPFQFSTVDTCILEFTHLKMRVWRYGSLVVTGGAATYEMDTPYDEAALASLRWVQSADVIYLADGVRQIHKLSRYALADWRIEPLALETGPFRVQNLAKSRKVTPSAETGTITLTAAHDTFAASDVGMPPSSALSMTTRTTSGPSPFSAWAIRSRLDKLVHYETSAGSGHQSLTDSS